LRLIVLHNMSHAGMILCLFSRGWDFLLDVTPFWGLMLFSKNDVRWAWNLNFMFV
jgi:hypothetical protein